MRYPTQIQRQQIRDKYTYNPETGELVKHARRGKGLRVYHTPVSNILANVSDAYRPRAAHVAWYLHYREWPRQQVIYKDGDPTNLKISNLTLKGAKRVVTSS